ncbi:hypothetical protein PAPYR_8055 [Paratrimastix pyriformis]|uniref:Uncharacterized protein n=1 Tax=Paratrimastix pyriformis TaxID=342808 RepID=A0ABQ8UBI8_9EUKA|nr:hypothetical protein PAPYR_8055 [Paratrimastix pyriformis]
MALPPLRYDPRAQSTAAQLITLFLRTGIDHYTGAPAPTPATPTAPTTPTSGFSPNHRRSAAILAAPLPPRIPRSSPNTASTVSLGHVLAARAERPSGLVSPLDTSSASCASLGGGDRSVEGARGAGGDGLMDVADLGRVIGDDVAEEASQASMDLNLLDDCLRVLANPTFKEASIAAAVAVKAFVHRFPHAIETVDAVLGKDLAAQVLPDPLRWWNIIRGASAAGRVFLGELRRWKRAVLGKDLAAQMLNRPRVTMESYQADRLPQLQTDVMRRLKDLDGESLTARLKLAGIVSTGPRGGDAPELGDKDPFTLSYRPQADALPLHLGPSPGPVRFDKRLVAGRAVHWSCVLACLIGVLTGGQRHCDKTRSETIKRHHLTPPGITSILPVAPTLGYFISTTPAPGSAYSSALSSISTPDLGLSPFDRYRLVGPSLPPPPASLQEALGAAGLV